MNFAKLKSTFLEWIFCFKGIPLVLLLSVVSYFFWDGAAAIMLSLFFHEFGHYLAMKYFRYEIRRFYFIPFFGAAVQAKSNFQNKYHAIIILLAGPVAGLFFGLLCGLACLYGDFSPELVAFFKRTLVISLILNCINLLTISPFDGGRALAYLLFRRGAGTFSVALYGLFFVLSSVLIFYYLYKINIGAIWTGFMIGLVVNAARYFIVMSRYFYRYKFRDTPFDELVQILNTENFGKNKKEISFNRSIFSWLLFSVSHSLEGKKTRLVSFILLANLLIISNVVLVGYTSRGHYSSMMERVFKDRALAQKFKDSLVGMTDEQSEREAQVIAVKGVLLLDLPDLLRWHQLRLNLARNSFDYCGGLYLGNANREAIFEKAIEGISSEQEINEWVDILRKSIGRGIGKGNIQLKYNNHRMMEEFLSALDSPQRTRLNELFTLGSKVSLEQACEAMMLVLENIDVFDEKPIMQRNLLQMLAINFTPQPFVTFEN